MQVDRVEFSPMQRFAVMEHCLFLEVIFNQASLYPLAAGGAPVANRSLESVSRAATGGVPAARWSQCARLARVSVLHILFGSSIGNLLRCFTKAPAAFQVSDGTNMCCRGE